MTSDEILVESYKEAVKHTNRGMFLGLIISGVLYIITYQNYLYNGVTIPILGLSINSKLIAVYSMWAVYFYCGLYANYYYGLSLSIFNEVTDYKIKRALTFYPSINMASTLQSALLSPFYIGLWYVISIKIELVESRLLSVIIGSILTFPYLIVIFNLSHERRNYQSIRKNKTSPDET
ncbi:hypothetical protein [Aeromonas jandaei]|uniref:hypothetical protein n=1 Tax=Aeromonas jandaei TaxID=650 RepID=UPI0012EC7D6D|nr:hypothetical protein [Aeromonas jandaei]